MTEMELDEQDYLKEYGLSGEEATKSGTTKKDKVFEDTNMDAVIHKPPRSFMIYLF